LTIALPLAPNKSALENALAMALATPDDIYAAPQVAENRIKTPSDEDLPFLIWEWGLQAVLPYISDPRETLRQGRAWQKKRGTLAAGEIARAWVGVIAEHEQAKDKYYHLHLSEFLTLDELEPVIALSRLSQSMRNRLYRLTYKYDVRAAHYADAHYGDNFYGIDSGARPYPDWPVLSFKHNPQIFGGLNLNCEIAITILYDRTFNHWSHLTYSHSQYGDAIEVAGVTGQDAIRLRQTYLTRNTFADLSNAPFRAGPSSENEFGLALEGHWTIKEVL
jgi:hypothetical protein